MQSGLGYFWPPVRPWLEFIQWEQYESLFKRDATQVMEITLGDIWLLKYKHNCESLPSITQGQILADPGATLREPPPPPNKCLEGGGANEAKAAKTYI